MHASVVCTHSYACSKLSPTTTYACKVRSTKEKVLRNPANTNASAANYN